MKTCTKCKIEKDEDCFSKNKQWCKECVKSYNKQYRIDNKEEIKENNKQYRIENKEEIKEYQKQYRIENKEEIKEYIKQYNSEHKKELKEYQKQYAIDNKEHIKEYQKQFNSEHKEYKKLYNKQYAIDNKEEIKEYRAENKEKINEYQKNRKKTDPAFKLRKNVSIYINIALRKNSSSKNGQSILKHLPYTIEELKQHLESLFEPWMNWNNWGIYYSETWDINDQSTWVWNLDHITPQIHLPYTSMEEGNFKICWSLENLRPYSAKKNIEEGNNRSQEEITKIKKEIRMINELQFKPKIK